MIRLDLKREPHWLDLGHGVRLYVRPCTTALMIAARAEVQRAAVSSANDIQAAGERTATLVKALGRLAIQEWEGVGHSDGEPAPLTPDGVDALLDLWPLADAFERLYLGPALPLDAERAVLRLIAVPLTDGQPPPTLNTNDAKASNCLQRSTLRRKVNREEHALVPAEFLKWIWAGGRKLKGLVRRRTEEAVRYSSV